MTTVFALLRGVSMLVSVVLFVLSLLEAYIMAKKKEKIDYITIHKAVGGYTVEAWQEEYGIRHIVYTSLEELCKGIRELFDG